VKLMMKVMRTTRKVPTVLLLRSILKFLERIIIHLGKDENGYVFENYTVEEISLEAQKDIIKEIANLASQYQPKGSTLNDTEVKIKQPFLIKGTLR